MLKKSIGIGMLAFVLFAFTAPAEVFALTKKQKEAKLQDALKDASKNVNLEEYQKHLGVITGVLQFVAEKAAKDKKIAKASKLASKGKEYYGYYTDLKEFLALAKEHKNAKTEAGKAGVMAKVGTKMFDSIDKLAGKGGWALGSYIKAITMCGRTLQALTLKHLGDILYTDFAANEDTTKVDIEPYRDMIVELKLADVDSRDICKAIIAMDALEKLK